MVLQVFRHRFASVEACLNLSVSDVAAYDDCSVEGEARAHWVLAELLANLVHWAVEVYAHHFALACVAEFFWDEFVWFVVHLLDPDTVLVDLTLDVAVGRA
jgi:hypothetical protein